jgi:membrane protein YdbS with pleckstrin-like domain
MGRVWWIAAGRILSLVSSFALVLTAFGLWRHCVAAAVLLIPLGVVVVNGCFTVLDRDSSGERVLYRRGVIWRSSFSLPLAEVQVFRSDTWPWDRWIGLRRVSLYYFAGGARRLFAWQAARPSTSIATIGFE